MFKKESKKKSAVSTKNNENQPRFYSLKRNTSKSLSPRYFALKIINKNRLKTGKDVEHTMSERYILEAIEHPFIVKLHYAFQTPSRLFLIVDLLAGVILFLFRVSFSIFWEKGKDSTKRLLNSMQLKFFWLFNIFIREVLYTEISNPRTSFWMKKDM